MSLSSSSRVLTVAPILLLAASCVRPPLEGPTPVSVRGPATVEPRVATPRPNRTPLEALRERGLVVPVAGVDPARIPDAFDARRGGDRRHGALDIMAPRGTPVLSADDGRILRLRTNSLGGITIYAADSAARVVYYYAHLERYRRGLREGDRVQRGDTIGYVGTSGNAPRGTPHLHFQVMLMPDDGRWWAGEPVNPLPLLRRSAVAAADAP